MESFDVHHRCIETWGSYAERADPSLSPRAPALLADHVTRARGIHHVRIEFSTGGYSEVVDSVQVRRFFGNEHGTVDKAVDNGGVTTRTYDAFGRPLTQTNAIEATTCFEWDRRGRLLAVTDPLGRTHR